MANRRPARSGLLAAIAVIAALVALSGCTSSGGTAATGSLPAADGLLKTASATMAGVTSVHFDLTINGTLSGVPVQSASGDLNAQGQAKGSAKVSELGALVQVEFVLADKNFYVKGATGGYTKIPAALAGNLFDPSAILDPNRGIAKILGSVQGARTVSREQVAGTDSYKISGKVAKDAVAALVPGLGSDVTASVWVSADSKNQPVKVEFAVPGADGAQGATVDVAISKVNEPVSVTAPS